MPPHRLLQGVAGRAAAAPAVAFHPDFGRPAAVRFGFAGAGTFCSPRPASLNLQFATQPSAASGSAAAQSGGSRASSDSGSLCRAGRGGPADAGRTTTARAALRRDCPSPAHTASSPPYSACTTGSPPYSAGTGSFSRRLALQHIPGAAVERAPRGRGRLDGMGRGLLGQDCSEPGFSWAGSPSTRSEGPDVPPHPTSPGQRSSCGGDEAQELAAEAPAPAGSKLEAAGGRQQGCTAAQVGWL